MIRADPKRAFGALTASLSAKAEMAAKARALSRLRAGKRDPWRWRDAKLLWPLFTSER